MKIQSIYLFFICLILAGCGAYSFTGTNIDADTINIGYIENQASLTSPYLQPQLTQKLKERVQNLTKLQILDTDSTDLLMTGKIVQYRVDVASLDNIDQATQNRLKVVVEINFENRKEPKDNFTRSFEKFEDFPADVTLQERENQLLDVIIELLVNDIFNAAFSNW